MNHVANEAFYLFGLSNISSLDLPDIKWMGQPLFSHNIGPFTAILAEVSIDDFKGTAAENKFKNVEWMTEKILQHEEILENIMHQAPVYPIQFGTLFSSLDNLGRLLMANVDNINIFLAQVTNHVEWAVKVLVNKHQAYSYLYNLRLNELTEPLNTLSSGTSYLKDKQLQASIKNELSVFLEDTCQNLLKNINSHSSKHAIRPIANSETNDPDSEVILNLAFLAPENNNFIQLIKKLNALYAKRGIALQLTGPWPAYSFSVELKTE